MTASPAAARTTAATLLTLLLTACGSGSDPASDHGSGTDCDLTGCSITFVRDGTPEVSVLGVDAKLVRYQGDQVTLEVAGQQVLVPVGGQTQSDGFTVRVERATDTEVVVRVTHGLGGAGG